MPGVNTPVRTYEEGDVVRIVATFEEDSEAVDPGAVVVRVKPPSGSLITPTVVKDSVGNYHADVTADDRAGIWHFRVEGTGANASADEHYFRVNASEF